MIKHYLALLEVYFFKNEIHGFLFNSIIYRKSKCSAALIDAFIELYLQLLRSLMISPAERLLALRVNVVNFRWVYIAYLLAYNGCVRTQVLNQHIWQLLVFFFNDYIHLVLVIFSVDSKETFTSFANWLEALWRLRDLLRNLLT